MKILITICARGGSKGIPGKNIKMIDGKPLIEYTINIAKIIVKKYDAKISISTDDILIKKIAADLGLLSDYNRPKELATDIAGKIGTIYDLLLYEESLVNFEYDYILDLDVTSPLRTVEDLEQSLRMLEEKKEALNLFSVNPATRNPYFNMVEQKKDGFFSLIKVNSDGTVLSRQQAPKVYDMNASFYWYRRSFFNGENTSAITNRSLVYVMDHMCFDLDHQVDFLFMEYLLKNNQLDFQL